ncbi:MAG: TonB-dependent receptor [Brevundimonas sp.]
MSCAPATAAVCTGSTLSDELLSLSRRSDLRVVFNPVRLRDRCVSGFRRSSDTRADLRRLAEMAGMDLVTLGGGLYALNVSRPSARPAPNLEDAPVHLTDIIVIAPSASPDLSGLWLERFSAQSVETLSSQQITDLPTSSVAEALRLVPGIQLDTQRGTGLHVTARGLDSPFQLVQVNGRSLALNELIENGGPRGRSFRFETLPGEFVSDVVVKKTATASDQGGAVGVTIDLRTPRPLTIGTGGAMSMHVADNSLSDGPGYGASGSISWVRGDGDLGLLASALVETRQVRNDRFFQFQWMRGPFSGVVGPDLYVPGRVRPTVELEERRQQALNMTLQWRPASGHLTEMDLVANRLEVAYDEFGLDIYPQATEARFVPGSQRLIDDTVVAGQIENVRWLASHETSFNRHDLISLGVRHSYVAESWSVSGDLAWSRAESGHPNGRGTSRSRLAFTAPLTFDFSGGYRVLPTLETSTNYRDPAVFSGWTYGYAPKRSVDTDTAGRLDLERRLRGPVDRLRAGIFAQKRTRDYRRRDWFLDGLKGVPLSALSQAFYQPLPFDDFLSGVAGGGPRAWLSPTADAYHAALFTNAVAASDLTVQDRAASYSVQEAVGAVYVEALAGMMVGSIPVDGVLGLRRSVTRQTSQGFLDEGGRGLPVRFDHTDGAWLPSLNVKAELRPDLVARVSAARVTTPANLTDIAPRLTASFDNGLANGGNPGLAPYTADAVDLGLDWYASSAQVFSIAVFRKRMAPFTTSEDRPIVLAGRTLELSTTVSGGEATLTGLELAVRGRIPLPEILPGRLTIGGAYTATDAASSFRAGNREIVDQLVGLSRSSLTLTAGYEAHGVTANIGWFWRDRYLNSYGGTTVGEEYVAPIGLLDAQIAWSISPSLTLVAEGSNLTGARKYLYGVNEDQPKEINAFGRTVQLSLRWRPAPW